MSWVRILTSRKRLTNERAMVGIFSGPTTLSSSATDLTNREREVYELLAEGRTNREIGSALFISEFTAKTHVANVLRKLGVRSRTQAALKAARDDS